MRNKTISADEAAAFVKDGMTLMVGGFMAVGTPEPLIDALLRSGVSGLTIIANDTGIPGEGIGKLISAKRIKKLMVSHIGLNPETGTQMNNKEIEVDLIPQGTLAERIRCGGAGLGGVLTATGIGTEVEEGKQKLVANGEEYLLELPLRADIAIIHGSIVDKSGNVFYEGTTRNFNPLMAMAADLVIVAAEKLVEAGEIDPSCVMSPAILVDYIVGGVA